SADWQLILAFNHRYWLLLANCISRTRHFNDKAFKFIFRSVNYWLIWQFLRWLIPWPPLFNSTRKSLCDQYTDFLSLQRDKLFIWIIFEKLRTKIHGVNSGIISFHIEEVLRSE